MVKVAIQTLGCKVNQSESASIEGILRSNNYEIVNSSDKPDIIIVNTCTVTAKSDYQSRQLIRRAARSGARVVATGCYAQLHPDTIASIEGIDMVIGNSGKSDILDYINKLDNKNGQTLREVTPPTTRLTSTFYHTGRTRAFLKIQDGCNHACTYCAVPLARGKSRSLSREEVVRAAKRLVNDGYKEVVLTGIHIGAYGLDLTPKVSLPDILKRLADEFPHLRIRLSSIEPHEVSKELLALVSDGSICPHLHVPLQSGTNKILKAMNRGYTTEFFEHVINSILTSYPGMSIGTDVIAGFPGETDKDFNDTVNLIDRLPFSYLHVFSYSKRPDTKASMLPDQVNSRVKKERIQLLISINQKKQKLYMSKYMGHSIDVIVEERDATSKYYRAISDNYLRVFLSPSRIKAGERRKVRVTSLTESGLIAEPII